MVFFRAESEPRRAWTDWENSAINEDMRNILIVTALVFLISESGYSAMKSNVPDREAIDQLAQNYAAAFASNKVDTVITCMTDDFVAITPDKPPVVGKAAVKAAITADFKHMNVLTLTFNPEEIFTTGDWGFARGSSSGTIRTLPDEKLITLKGKFLWILKREHGAWKVARDSAFGDEPKE
jgi:ketosteroid isomerase-like protein